MNPEQEPYDIWYQIFLDSGKPFGLDTDRDQVNDYRWAVFFNARITDSDGSLMGVCGIGLFMDEIQQFLEKAESKWDLKVNLVDASGLVQADVDSSNIENAYISDAIADGAGPDSFTYAKRSFGGFRMTRYMDKLDWYLIVQGTGSLSDKDWLSAPLVIVLYLILAALFVLCLTAFPLIRRTQEIAGEKFSQSIGMTLKKKPLSWTYASGSSRIPSRPENQEGHRVPEPARHLPYGKQ